MSALGEAELVAVVDAAVGGDRDAFGRLWVHYQPMVFGYVYRRVGHRYLAEDLTADVFVRALRNIGAFERRDTDLGAWLFTIARNVVADHFKRAATRLEVARDYRSAGGFDATMLEANLVPRVASAEDVVVDDLDDAALWAAVDRLTDEQRTCLRLRYVAELSVAETADVMGKAGGAVKALAYRACRTLARSGVIHVQG